MKIKVKDEAQKIKLTVNHPELMIIYKALKDYQGISTKELNDMLFDFQEFDKDSDIVDLINTMKNKIRKKLNNIFPY